ncbi:PREDICTED: calcium-binding allergen Ole e 8-like [Ipomoea nil]|uniref:calcium-binding allergen Ole e 8-like n=1 Tax=Ipomoea nil TaxID=35883 RepID=UPI00090090C2|nr:PREDICTED: calcium-binding allergen Ole e 8-like [Ipomoea nil]
MASNGHPKPAPLECSQDMNEVQKVFDRFDSNHDGKISPEELSGVLEKLGSGVSPKEVCEIMEDIDTNKDGFINLQEFAGFCKGRDGDSADKELREAFELYDQDRNGLISAAELHLILTRLGEQCSVDDCAGMIKSFDTDGDGNVSFEEFRTMMAVKP